MADLAGIRVEGLKELRRSIAKLPEVKNGLRQDLLDIGRKIVTDAQSTVPTGKTGKAKASIRAGVSGNNAYIAGGKKTVPYYGWLDFGTRNPQSGQRRSQGPWKRSGKGPERGRFLYPAIDRNAKNIKKAAVKAFDRVERQR